MKKILTGLFLTVSLALPIVSMAQAPTTAPTVDFMTALDNIVNWLFSILLVIAAIAIIIAAYYFITASGDPDKTNTARNFVIYALVGVLVAFLAKGLILLIAAMMGVHI